MDERSWALAKSIAVEVDELATIWFTGTKSSEGAANVRACFLLALLSGFRKACTDACKASRSCWSAANSAFMCATTSELATLLGSDRVVDLPSELARINSATKPRKRSNSAFTEDSTTGEGKHPEQPPPGAAPTVPLRPGRPPVQPPTPSLPPILASVPARETPWWT